MRRSLTTYDPVTPEHLVQRRGSARATSESQPGRPCPPLGTPGASIALSDRVTPPWTERVTARAAHPHPQSPAARAPWTAPRRALGNQASCRSVALPGPPPLADRTAARHGR